LREHEAARVSEKLDYARDLVARKDKKVSKNPAGFLIAAIRGDFAVPKPVRTSSPKLPTTVRARPGLESTRKDDGDRAVIDAYLGAMTGDERDALEASAVANAQGFLAKQYHDGKGTGGALFLAARQAIIDGEVRRALEGGPRPLERPTVEK